jgi:hypothetical protein
VRVGALLGGLGRREVLGAELRQHVDLNVHPPA